MGLVDTAFVARIGSDALAGLGAGTALLSACLWAFNFLGVGTQTEVARSLGAGDRERGGQTASAALWLAASVGLGLALLLIPLSFDLAGWMGTRGTARDAASAYLWIRLLGAPAVLVMTVGFGALRGLQDVRTPLRIAVAVNIVNLALDPLLIFGFGPVPALGVAGAAWASTASQWIGALAAGSSARSRLPLVRKPRPERFRSLLRIGIDVVLRSGALLLYLLLATRAANRLGSEAGAAHQAIRSVWMFSAFLLDAYSHAAQSLIGYFLGRQRREAAVRVARVACGWAAASGLLLGGLFLVGEAGFRWFLVPGEAAAVFSAAWALASLQMPINAVVFATDGIHWGASDYAFVRNGMLVALGFGSLGLILFGGQSLTAVWAVTALWIGVRAGFGILRIWPGVGRAPLRHPAVSMR